MLHKVTLSTFLIVVFLISACTAEPSSSSSAASPSASASSKTCPPIACTQPSGKPKCPSECADSCHFETDKCCPNKQIGVCTSSGSSSATPTGSSASASETSIPSSVSGVSSSSTGLASSSGVVGSSSSSQPSASAASPPTSDAHTTTTNLRAYLFSAMVVFVCMVLLK